MTAIVKIKTENNNHNLTVSQFTKLSDESQCLLLNKMIGAIANKENVLAQVELKLKTIKKNSKQDFKY